MRGAQSGRRVEDRGALLDAYQTALVTVRAKPSISVGVAPGVDVVDEVARAGKAWDSSDTAWAATGVVAAAVMATVASDTMATRVEELRVAPWPRVYVDLASLGVRGEEAAEHLRAIVE